MCPDSEALSAYFDDELDSLWAEKIKSHLSGCPVCRQRIAEYQGLRHKLLGCEHPDHDEPLNRVWGKLVDSRETLAFGRSRWWKKSIAVPLPVFAIAAAVLVVFGAVFALNLAQNDVRMMKITTEPSGITEVQVSAPIKDLEVLLKSLERQNAKREKVIELPEESRFFILGEPVLLRADEFSQGVRQ